MQQRKSYDVPVVVYLLVIPIFFLMVKGGSVYCKAHLSGVMLSWALNFTVVTAFLSALVVTNLIVSLWKRD